MINRGQTNNLLIKQALNSSGEVIPSQIQIINKPIKILSKQQVLQPSENNNFNTAVQ
jgi:hypothetical protein